MRRIATSMLICLILEEVAASKGSTVRRIKRYMIWVQNVVKQFGFYLLYILNLRFNTDCTQGSQCWFLLCICCFTLYRTLSLSSLKEEMELPLGSASPYLFESTRVYWGGQIKHRRVAKNQKQKAESISSLNLSPFSLYRRVEDYYVDRLCVQD